MPDNKKNWLYNRILSLFETKLLVKNKTADALELLNPQEQKVIRNNSFFALFWAAVFGTAGVLLLYIPQYYFPDFFNLYVFRFYPAGIEIEIAVVSLIYGIILAYLEVTALALVNLQAIGKIAEICGYPDENEPENKEQIRSLIDVGLEQEENKLKPFGINPYQGLSKFRIFLYLAYEKLKASLTNMFVKALIRRILGRYALREIIDMAGIPVYAFWNAMASYRVIKETKVRIMASSIIKHISEDLKTKYSTQDKTVNKLIFQALQYIAICKRKYHFNHYWLARKLYPFIENCNSSPLNEKLFLKELSEAQSQLKNDLLRLIIFGFLMDGDLSAKEKDAIEKLNRLNIVSLDYSTVKSWKNSFVQGKGLKELLEYKFV